MLNNLIENLLKAILVYTIAWLFEIPSQIAFVISIYTFIVESNRDKAIYFLEGRIKEPEDKLKDR